MNFESVITIGISFLSILSFTFTIYGNIRSFYVPWVRSNVVIDQGYYKLNIPIDIGLLKCFSDICHKYEKYINSLNSGNIDETSVDLFPIHLPNKPPDLQAIIRNEVRKIEKPYKLASTTCIPFLILAIIVCFVNVLISIYCLIKHKSYYHHYLLSLLLLSILSNTIGVLSYIAVTISHVNGGEYLYGVWMITFSTIGSMAIALLIAVFIDNSNKRSGYIQLSHNSSSLSPRLVGIEPNQVTYDVYQTSGSALMPELQLTSRI